MRLLHSVPKHISVLDGERLTPDTQYKAVPLEVVLEAERIEIEEIRRRRRERGCSLNRDEPRKPMDEEEGIHENRSLKFSPLSAEVPPVSVASPDGTHYTIPLDATFDNVAGRAVKYVRNRRQWHPLITLVLLAGFAPVVLSLGNSLLGNLFDERVLRVDAGSILSVRDGLTSWYLFGVSFTAL